MRRIPYVITDVFTSTALTGNQLAVVTDAHQLREDELQLLAKETNLSETTFIYPRDAATERERGVKVRIFTTDEELEFAGHPTLGTANVLRGTSGAKEVALELRAGTIPVRFEDRASGPAYGEMTQRDPVFGQIMDRAAVAQAIGLTANDLEADLPVQTVSTGLPFAIVPVKNLAKLQTIPYSWQRAQAFLKSTDAKFFYMVCRETVDPSARIHARMIFYNGEDPATGSASGCAAAWMAKYGVAASDEKVMIEQGIEMKRPSKIYVTARRDDDRVVNVRVGGSAIEVARGEFTLL